MLPELLNLYRVRGFTFVTLPRAVADPVYAEDSDIAYTNGDTLTEQLSFKRGMNRPGFSKQTHGSSAIYLPLVSDRS
jgi:hypothetical protein